MTSRQGAKAQKGDFVFGFLFSAFGQYDPVTPDLRFSPFHSLRLGACRQAGLRVRSKGVFQQPAGAMVFAFHSGVRYLL
jgi:hypothetical protein